MRKTGFKQTISIAFITLFVAILSACSGGGSDSNGGIITTVTPTYTVTYNGNSSTSGTVPVDTGAYEEGETVTVLANTGSLIKSGYYFNGWNTAADGSGTIYTAGSSTFTMGASDVTLYARWDLTAKGELDSTFDISKGLDADVDSMAIQDDGKIIIGGYFSGYNGTSQEFLARLSTDGSLDTAFTPTVNGAVYAITVQTDGKILIGGVFTTCNGESRNRIARLNADGSLDTTFTPGTGANSDVYAIAVQNDGKIIMGGSFTSYNGTAGQILARLNADGTLDSSFEMGSNANNEVAGIAIQGDGKIVIGGDFWQYKTSTGGRIARVNSDGTLDSGFDMGSGVNNDHVTSVAVLDDGRIIFVGRFTEYNGTARNRIAVVNADGSIDTTFDLGTGANDDVYAMAIQEDGKIVIAGYFTSYNGTARYGIARLNTDGTLDTAFDPGSGANDEVLCMAIQKDGKIVIGGYFTEYDGTAANFIARIE